MSFKPKPKYKIGDIVDCGTYTGFKENYRIIDVQWVWHMKNCEYTWGYKLNEDENGSTGLTLIYIPESYLRTKQELLEEQSAQEEPKLTLQEIKEIVEEKLEDAVDEYDYYSSIIEDNKKASTIAKDIVFYRNILKLVEEKLNNEE